MYLSWLNMNDFFFSMRVMKYENRLPRDAPFLETFKVQVDGDLSNLIKLEMSLFTAG